MGSPKRMVTLRSSRNSARTKQLSPPIEGWDTRSALSDMKPERAVILDNWFPRTNDLIMREGHAPHKTGMSGNVDTLMTYAGLTGLEKMFAANGTSIFDVSAAGAVGGAVVSSMTNAQWIWTMHGTSAGEFLLAANGADVPRTYNGTSWSTFGATGPTVANIGWIHSHQRRLFAGEDNSLSFWFLGVNAITGTMTEFPLHGIAQSGGYIMAMGTWTRDAGDGFDDFAVFVTSEGEVIIYAGYDPGDASIWILIGVYRIGPPVGRRCLLKAGADLLIITVDGFVPLSQIIQADRSQSERFSVSRQIESAVTASVKAAGSEFGWQIVLYPAGNMLLFNVPQNSTSAHQYVFNTITNAPCRFTGMNARCWGLLNDELYFGGVDGVVYKHTGKNDNGANISADALQAFNKFGTDDEKWFKRVELMFESVEDPNPAVEMQYDYRVSAPKAQPVNSTTAAGLWGSGLWGKALWGSSRLWRRWFAVRGRGRAAGVRVRINSKTVRAAWLASNFLWVPGGRV